MDLREDGMFVTVFGGSGFLGSHLADALSDAGMHVRIFDREGSAYLRPDQEMILGDILDKEAVSHSMQGSHAVYNLAGIADLDDCSTKPALTVTQNILGNVHILEGCLAQGVKRVVYASSIYVNSTKGGFYRCSKQAAETYVEEFKSQYDLDFTILRYGTLYGPRADRRNSVYRYLRQALTDKRIVIGASGEELREYIHVRDAVRLSVDILAPEYANKRINITGHHPIRFRDLLETIREMFDNHVDITLAESRNKTHYSRTPYSYQPKPCYKLTSNLSVDLGQGLLECLQEIALEMPQEGNSLVVQTMPQSEKV